MLPNFLERNGGLIRAVAQCVRTGRVLMDAHMNKEALHETRHLGQVVYLRRSTGKLWHKGEESGCVQLVREIRINCYGDSLLLLVEQVGGAACHTGYPTCFYRRLDMATGQWNVIEERVFDPDTVYGSKQKGGA